MNPFLNPTLAIGPFGPAELLLILAVLILLFGAKKLPQLAKGLGQSIKEFKKASDHEDTEETDEKKAAAKKTDTPDKPDSAV